MLHGPTKHYKGTALHLQKLVQSAHNFSFKDPVVFSLVANKHLRIILGKLFKTNTLLAKASFIPIMHSFIYGTSTNSEDPDEIGQNMRF